MYWIALSATGICLDDPVYGMAYLHEKTFLCVSWRFLSMSY